MTDPIPGFVTTSGQTIAREKLIAYLNTGTSAVPSWSALGYRVNDSSMEFDWSDETNQDIIGITRTTMKNPVITQSFEPLALDSADSAAVKIWELAVKDKNPQALSAQDILIVHYYYAPDTATPAEAWAERYPASAVRPTGLGGEGGGNIEMPIDITYGGKREVGKATVSGGTVTFTADAAETGVTGA